MSDRHLPNCAWPDRSSVCHSPVVLPNWFGWRGFDPFFDPMAPYPEPWDEWPEDDDEDIFDMSPEEAEGYF